MSEALFQVGDEVGSIIGDVVLKKCTTRLSAWLENGKCLFDIQHDGTHPDYAVPVIWHKETGHGPVTGERPKWVPTGPCYARCWDFNKCNADECLIQGYDSNNPEEPYRIAPDVGYAYAEPCDPPPWANLWPRSEL